MSQLEDLIRFENANSSLAFRERTYGADEGEDLVRELLALANAAASGPRFMFFGVEDAASETRRIVGIAETAWNDLRSRVDAVVPGIEPSLTVAMRMLKVDGASVGMLFLPACDDPPYLLARAAGPGLPAGAGWIRRGTRIQALLRADLQRIFADKLATAAPLAPALAIGFPGDVLQREIALPVLALDRLPSAVAVAKVHKILAVKESARAAFGRTETGLSRLVHAQVYGADTPYESHSDNSLRMQIERAAKDFRTEDEHYSFELRAHKLDLRVSNPGPVALQAATLQFTLPRRDALGIAERLYTATGFTRDGYPRVTTGKHTINVEVAIGTIAAAATRSVFREPPRLWARPGAGGVTLPVDVTLHARELREPVRETLLIRIVDGGR
jgi:hypothetical protein